MSHTPGPWKAHKKHPQEWHINTGREPTLEYDTWKSMAIVYGCDDEPRKGAQVAQANARLIAAAPDMLCALSKIANVDTEPMLASEVIALARAAVLKATQP